MPCEPFGLPVLRRIGGVFAARTVRVQRNVITAVARDEARSAEVIGKVNGPTSICLTTTRPNALSPHRIFCAIQLSCN
jgi:hypothetical protein